MEFNVIDCLGEFRVERVSSLPTPWNSDYEGRMVYTRDTDRLYIGIVSAWRLLAKTTDDVDLTATAAEINLACDGIIATADDLNYLDGITEPLVETVMIKNLVNRPRFIRSARSSIDIGPGSYYHYGTTEQIVYWNTPLTKTGSGGGGNFNYLYLDDSAIVLAGSPVLTEDEFTYNTTAPTWEDAKHGWYHPTNTNDRCIFVIKSGGWGSIKKFYHNGGRYVEFDERISDYETSDPKVSSSAWVTVSLSLPDFGDESQGHITFIAQNSNVIMDELFYRKTGSSSSGNTVGFLRDWYNGQQNTLNSRITTVDGSQGVQVKYAVGAWAGVRIHTNGYYLPRGM